MRGRHRIVVEALRGVLEEDKVALTVRGFDVVGDIAVIRVPEQLEAERFLIGQALQRRLPYIKTVLAQVGAVEGDFRTRNLEWLSGEQKTVTFHREHGCVFEVDLARTYFSPRLLHERFRVAELCRYSSAQERVLNMFSGVGCFSIMIAKRSSKAHVYSVDLNPEAVRYQLRNIRLNKVRDKVTVVFADARYTAESLLRGCMNRVLMPLPEKAYAYLHSALAAIGPEGGTIHYYDFAHAYKHEDPVEKTALKIAEKLGIQSRSFTIEYGRVVRTVGPNWYQIVLDIAIV